MNETLLQAERLLSVGLLDQAEALYLGSLEQQPGDALALMGLARVSIERGDDLAAHAYALRAVAADPENSAARAMATRWAELLRARGASVGRAEPVVQPLAAGHGPATTAGSRRTLLRRVLRR